ncbi:rCG55316 [Rattus norvegicus]|uniref:RCG55316 n=1 Tax=Rattus norvegicus TaxID=10116 RepID=A6KF35_RAT|nr:rCG55316 [Rattus norvegicus]
MCASILITFLDARCHDTTLASFQMFPSPVLCLQIKHDCSTEQCESQLLG